MSAQDRHPQRFGSWILIAASMFLGLSAEWSHGDEIEFVVGGWTAEEGGTWNPKESPLLRPFGVDFDSRGVMYIVELEGGRVHRLSSEGGLEQIAGDGSKAYVGDGGPAKDAKFNGMHNGVIRNDELLISDSWNHCVRRINLRSGTIDTIVGTGAEGFAGDGGPAREAAFNFLMCIELSPDGRKLHLTDLKNRRIRDFNFVDGTVVTVAGNGSQGVPREGSRATESPLVDPRAAASDADGNLYVLERNGHALRVVRPSGTIHTVAGTGERGWKDGPGPVAEFGAPKHLCTGPTGEVYIADDLNGAIRKYNPKTGTVTTLLGRGIGDERIRLLNPHGVRVHAGRLYVVDSGQNRVISIRLP